MRESIEMEKKQIEIIRKTGRKYSKISKVTGGKNSNVYYAKDTNNNEYCFKFYPEITKIDKRERLKAETTFMKYLTKCEVRNIPRILYISKEENWVMTDWITGVKPKNMGTKEIEHNRIYT